MRIVSLSPLASLRLDPGQSLAGMTKGLPYLAASFLAGMTMGRRSPWRTPSWPG